MVMILVGGDWNMAGLCLSIQLGINRSQLTNSIIFQRGRYTTRQIRNVDLDSNKLWNSPAKLWIWPRVLVKACF